MEKLKVFFLKLKIFIEENLLGEEEDVERESLTPQVERKKSTPDSNPLSEGVKELGQNLRDSIKGFKKAATVIIAKN